MWTMANAKTSFDISFGPKNDLHNLDVKLKVFKKDDNKEFQLV